jgi:hypothetical protein
MYLGKRGDGLANEVDYGVLWSVQAQSFLAEDSAAMKIEKFVETRGFEELFERELRRALAKLFYDIAVSISKLKLADTRV